MTFWVSWKIIQLLKSDMLHQIIEVVAQKHYHHIESKLCIRQCDTTSRKILQL